MILELDDYEGNEYEDLDDLMEELLEEIPDIKDNTKERIDDEDNLEGNAKWV